VTPRQAAGDLNPRLTGLIALEEQERFNPKTLCDATNIVDGDVTFSPFDGAEICAIDPTFMRQSLLAETARGTEATHVLRQNVP
jgi:hypothetical protein